MQNNKVANKFEKKTYCLLKREQSESL